MNIEELKALEVERLREACEGLLASIRSRYPNDFMPGGKGYVCPHHRAIAAALATDASGALTSAHATVLATAQAELAALRAKWEALRGECEAVRELGDWSANTHNPRSSEVESTMLRLLGEVIAARTLTDSTHALEEE